MNQSVVAQPGGQVSTRRVGEVHVFDTGRLVANKTFLRGEGFLSLLRRVELIEFPVLAYVIEHPEGLIAVDTGLGAHVSRPRTFRGFPPVPKTPGVAEEVGPQMRACGLDPGEVRWVILTHLDWDHTGGLHHFPRAEVLVHRPEYQFAQTRLGRGRYRPSLWPESFAPSLFDLEPIEYGPFPASVPITEAGDVRLVPVPGHSPGQVAVALDTGESVLLFSADHMLRADWFVEDLEADRPLMLGDFGKQDARETTRRLREFVQQRRVVLLPAHDSEASARLARREAVELRLHS